MNNEHGECEYAQLGVYYLDCHCPKQCTWQRQGAYWPSCSKANGEKPEIYGQNMMNAKQLAMVENLTFGPSDFHCDLNADSDSGYQFGNGYAYGMNNQPYSIVCRKSDDKAAFIPTDAGEAFATCDWLNRFNEAGKPDREAHIMGHIEQTKI
jgi:hypothetical protein